MGFIVTEAAQRPACMDGTCFYCHQSIGTEHKADCVLIKKKVKVRMTVEYEVDVPADWGKEMIEFHRNDSSWCVSNAIAELEERFGDDAEGCMCMNAKFEHIADTGAPFLGEE